MKYVIEVWKLGKLLDQLNERDRVNLNPEYQRNAIWSLPVQRHLIDTILSGMPLPSFFVRKMPESRLEMVDGQQRSRAIKNYFNNIEVSNGVGKFYKELDDAEKHSFLDYMISVVILDVTVTDNEVRDFYVLVNSSGMKLNKAELRKAQYHNTQLLALCSKLAGMQCFSKLQLFGRKSADRMNDVDFVSELIAYLIEKGPTDKKISVESAYKEDISADQAFDLENKFVSVIETINKLNEVTRISDTRLGQKADFYTLFGFVHENRGLAFENLLRMYALIISIDNDISPSQDFCMPLKEYALACVSQSNSKKAREERRKFFEKMFLNSSEKPTDEQLLVASFKDGKIVRVNGYICVEVGG